MTQEQQLIEEAAFLSDLLNQFTAERIEMIPSARDLFNMILKRHKYVKDRIANG